MDPAARSNLLLVGAALLALAAIWLLLSGFAGGGPPQAVAGLCAAMGSVAVFRVYRNSRGG